MGLTIHYTLKSPLDDVAPTVQAIRQLALDLPFEEVGEIVDLVGEACNVEARRKELQNGDDKNESLFWLMIQAGKHVKCPWNKRISRSVNPTRIIAFNTWPGHGCEAANFGLCFYPKTIDWEYKITEDQRFQEAPKDGFGVPRFSIAKWDRYLSRRRIVHGLNDLAETHQVPTKLAGWRWGSFCKTQYASDPSCGGMPNFLRCHISVITLLERMAKIPGLKVKVDDEGKYGPSTYSTDAKEAYEADRKPTYRRHKGKYSPAALAEEVGEWNTMIAGFSGALSDALSGSGMVLAAPIKAFANFEQLEFRGRNTKYLDPFLKAMKTLAATTKEST